MKCFSAKIFFLSYHYVFCWKRKVKFYIINFQSYQFIHLLDCRCRILPNSNHNNNYRALKCFVFSLVLLLSTVRKKSLWKLQYKLKKKMKDVLRSSDHFMLNSQGDRIESFSFLILFNCLFFNIDSINSYMWAKGRIEHW
jgi:hypothetical protein